ncbi:GMC oxidoreductase family protein [Burkholderia thailandensis E264]|uniref:Oxidoreductase, GMC family protein n=1 Tax=Burkholderia thailandensis (strain ATCC 700388 / DSM 13276 / CCUG 48851 / CIP 106301 / E264) TaxID=271848 RepID=Q2STC5_BURTA|nr:GMC family oxidoreductase N-terminal domain-containing protein [Burkholderia thailandensis]ABC37103.1 oxidoreductase, GMC family protein [Burkholderia thailandensis E264]AHI72088.1 GMC oxidoreductase family protein [Burkholderia thailandensis 2002721723]AIP26863.1 GMC oxidoreductase family protein [Burkholderia thailandensis E264]AJX99169.1 GMC oxidoreductase family protein [Burkholderia thailandensis 2002721643]NBC91984.1 choline dehydrogenase [Burkholderia thailandensis]
MATERTLEGEFDYVIVGAGTAGCVLANRLTEDPDVTVLLLEAGGKDDYHWIHIPVGYLYCIGNPRTDWLYKTEPEAGLNGRALSYPRGRVLGGSSSINGMIYMRGQRGDYDDWAHATGDAGWSWDSVLPIFRRSEHHHAGATDVHGAGGMWRVEKQRLRWEILEAFSQAAQQTGIPATDDFNRGDNTGVGYFEVNQKRGVRWNASKAFLRPALARPNLTVITGAQAERLVFDGKRCAGVEYLGGGAPFLARARIEVLVASGAVNSPQLLELSGIGDGSRLQALGIGVVADLRGVGENLQDHLQLRMAFRVRGVRTLNTLSAHWWGKLWIGAQYALMQRGPMSMAPSQLGAFAKSDPNDPALTRPDLEYHVQPLSLERFGEPLHRFNAFTASVCHLRPTSRGSIHAVSPDPARAPAIAPNYLSTDHDRHVAANALRLTRRIAAAPALARYAPEEILPGAQYLSEAELIAAAGAVGTTIFHPVGTCRMGRADDPDAVVDSRLRVRGVTGLRIVDASVMPTITSGNTNSPTLMIAERASDMIRADRRGAPERGAAASVEAALPT